MRQRRSTGRQRRRPVLNARRPARSVERTHAHPARFRWTRKLLASLGRLPDVEVAARARTTAHTVAAERRRRGIPAARERRANVEWAESMLRALGTDTDENIAGALGLPRGVVTYRRLLLGIPGFSNRRGRASEFRWTAWAMGLLGKASDRQVAKRLGIHEGTVSLKRRRLGIACFAPSSRPVAWPKERLELLGRLPDAEIARRMRVHPSSVARKRGKLGIAAVRPWFATVRTGGLKRLLRRSNRELVEKHGLSRWLVTQLRGEYGIPAPGRHPKRWTAAAVTLLGQMPDTEVARRLGIEASSVREKRYRLAIPACPRGRAWTAAELRLLGRIPDTAIARRLGVRRGMVGWKRRGLGIQVKERGA